MPRWVGADSGFRYFVFCCIHLFIKAMHVDPFIRRKPVPDEKVVPHSKSARARGLFTQFFTKNKELFLREITSLTWVLR